LSRGQIKQASPKLSSIRRHSANTTG
jgi:hypothetical protein